MNTFQALLWLQRFPLAKASKRISDLLHLSETELIKYQDAAKSEIFEYHLKHNAWYRSFVEYLRPGNWSDIPILEKRDIQGPLERIMTAGYDQRSVYINNTSGSTGVPLYFAKDKYCHAMTWAYIFRQYQNVGLEYGRSLQARFFGIPLSSWKHKKEKFKDWVASRERFPVFNMSDDVLNGYLDRFRRAPFVYVYGYTSALVLFAKFIGARGVRLADVCPTLKRCIVTSEVCDSVDRGLLEEMFGVPVTNEYGAAELDIIGFEDSNGRLIINEENLFVEVVNAKGEPVSYGEEGEVVVTSLYNKAMPFIRYRLGDIVTLAGEKVRGRRVIERLQGRINDVALLPSGRKAPGLTFYYVSKSMLEASGAIKEFVIKQVAPTVFQFEYVADSPLTMDQQLQVQNLLDTYLEPGLTATFEKKAYIQRTAAGKFKHFQRLVD